jgi:hypothetical protein
LQGAISIDGTGFAKGDTPLVVIKRREVTMPDRKHRFSKKEDRMAEHVKDSEVKRGKSKEDAERIGYATANKHKQEHTSRDKK